MSRFSIWEGTAALKTRFEDSTSSLTFTHWRKLVACQPVEKRPRWPPRAAPMMLPSATDLVANGNRRAQGCRLCQFLRSALPKGEQPLHILARGNQQRFYVDLLEPSQAEPSHPVPVFGFGEQRLHPYPPLAQRFFVEEGTTVAFHPIDVLLIEVAQDLPSRLAGRALCPQRASLAGASLRPVASQASGHVAGARHQELARRARVKVALGIVGELVLAEEGASLSSALERHVGMDARLLDGCYVLHGAVGRVTGHPPRLALPPEGGSPEHVQHGLVLGDLKGGDQDAQDDARLAAIHHAVGLVTEVAVVGTLALHG